MPTRTEAAGDLQVAPKPRRSPTPAVPDVVAPPPHHPRFPLMDGLRAVAVLAVVGVHAAQFGGAMSTSLGGRLLAHLNVGVTIFFVISGFLLYRPFIAHRGGGPPAPAVRDYFKRRFLRIYPAYCAALSLLIVIPGFTAVADGNWLSMYTLTDALGVGGGRTCSQLLTHCALAQTWSLAAEVTFYLALPLFAVLVSRLTGRLGLRAWLVIQLGLLALLSAVSVLLAYGVAYPAPLWLGYSVVGNLLWFSLGMAMAVISVARDAGALSPGWSRTPARWPAASWAVAIAAYFALALTLPATPFLFFRGQLLTAHLVFGAIAALLVAPAVFSDGRLTLPHRVLGHRLVAWLGSISYGIFLWHYAVALKLGSPAGKASFVVVLVGTVAISTVCAAVSYYVLERPLLRLKYRRLSELRWRRAAAVETAL